jgi:hypothetical protein
MDSNHRWPAYEAGALGRCATARVRWCPRQELNLRPFDYRSSALPAELRGRGFLSKSASRNAVVGTARFELTTPCAQGRCSGQAELSPEDQERRVPGQIRTGVELALAGFADRCLQPLSHGYMIISMPIMTMSSMLEPRVGFEPTNRCLRSSRSGQLSYPGN